jgi:elongation factor Ts
MAISAGMVRELRDKTGAAMMDCKKALEATAGDMDAAIDHMRKAGLAKALKKADRETSDGKVSAKVSPDGRRGSLVAIACETDFVAKTEDFSTLLRDLTDLAFERDLGNGGAAALLAQAHVSGSTVEEHLSQVISKLGENIKVADAVRFTTTQGYLAAYVHHNHKIGALVAIRTKASAEQGQAMATKVCQHVAFHKPLCLDRSGMPAELVERERAIYRESEELAAKPAEMREKIVTGKVEKFFAEKCLVEQPFIFDDKLSVAKAVEKELGAGSAVEFYSLMEV